MSFIWDAVDQRQKQKLEADRQLKDFLVQQQDELKKRKLMSKQLEMEESRRLYQQAQPQPVINDNRNVNAALWNATNPSTKVVTSAGNWQYQSNPSPSLPAGSTSKRQSFQADNNNNNNVFKNANLPAASTITNTRQSFDGSLSSQQQPQLSAAAEVNNAQQSSSLKKTNSYIISSSSNNEDILSKLRFTEEQLIQERRSRSWLESEIQSGKNLVATLTAKVEKLNDSFTVESLTVRELQRQLDMSSTVAKEGTKDLSSKLEKDNLKLQQMFSEVAARQRHYEKNTEDYEIKNRALMEELNQMRYKVESFALKASETNNEVKAATHELDIEHQRSSEAFRVLQDQGHAIEVLHNNVETKSETIKRTVDMTVYETRQRLDAESRNRSLFEQNTKDFISEQRKVMMSQERALAERIDSTRRGILQIVDLEKQDREKSVAVAIEQIRNWEKTMKESEAQLMSRIMQHYTSLESGMTEERTLRTKFEIAIRADVEDAFRMLKDLIAQKSTETMDSHMDLKQKVVNAVKVLQDSMTLTEKTLQARVSTIEEVLRAEIKSRMDAESKVEAAFADNMQVVSSLEGNIMGQVDLIAQELRESDASVLKELGDTKEQLSASKSRSIVDLETQIKQVHQRIKEDEKEAMEKSKMLQTHLQKLSADYQAAIENAVEQLNVRIVAAKVDTEELRVLIRGTNDTVQANKTAIEEKVSMRAVQLDQALEAFKEDLRLKMAIVDGESMEANLKSMLAGLSSSVSEMGKTLTDTKDSIETRATKNDLDDTEAKLKLSISTVAEKTSEMSEALNATKEQFALYSLIPDVDQIKANLKASISQLEARDMQIEELLISQRSELSERVLKSQVNETEDRLRKLLNELETGQSQLQESIDLLKGDFGNKISMNSLKDLEKKLVTEIDAATSQIRFNIEEIKSQHRETKLKLKESIDGINSQLANTTVKAEGAMNGVETIKSKLNETDTNIKTKLKEAMHAHEAVMTDQLLLLETIKEATQEQLYELASKIEDIPNTLRYSELQYSDFRRQITESTLKEQQKFSTLLGELQDLISKKVSSEDFESLQSDIKSNYQRVASQLDIERVIIEQLKERIHEVEGQARERIKEILTVQERGLGDQENSSKVWRDAAFKRLEELDTRLKHYPKLFETTFGDIKQIRTDVDSKVNHDLHNLEKEIKSLKSDVSKVSGTGIMDSVTNAVAPLHSRIERLSTLIEQIQVDSAAKNTVASRVVPEDELIAKYVNAFKGQSFTAKHNPDSVVIAPIVALKSAPSPPPQAASAAAAVTTTTATTTQKALNNELTKTKSSSSIYKPAQIPLKNRENETVASSRGSSASSFNAGANNPISVKANQSEDETEEGEDGSAEPKTTSSRHSIVPVKVSSARKKNNSNHSLVGNAAALARSGSQASSVHKKPPLVKQESSESISTKKSAELMYQNLADLATKTNLEGSVVKLPVTPTKDEDPDSPREF